MSFLGGRALSRARLLDRYIVREMLAPTGIGLLVFTFILLIDQIPRLLTVLVARSADFSTILRVFLNLLPSILAITIPMAFLLGVLLAFGRLASDSEIVALRAVGVSPLRLLSPGDDAGHVMAAITFYIMAVALPAANQAYRELVFSLVVSKARTDVKPRIFNDDLHAGRHDDVRLRHRARHRRMEERASSTTRASLARDQADPGAHRRPGDRPPAAERARSSSDAGSQHSFFGGRARGVQPHRLSHDGHGTLPVDEFFPDREAAPGQGRPRDDALGADGRSVRDLRARRRPRAEWGRFAVEWHKKFAIPAPAWCSGCSGLGLSLGSKKEARSAAFGLSIAVIFIYYVLIRLGEQAGDTGQLRPWLVDVGRQHRARRLAAIVLLYLNHREAAFDPLDPSHYLRFCPHPPRRPGAAARAAARPRLVAPRPVVVLRIPRLRLRLPVAARPLHRARLDRQRARSC